MRNQSSLDKYQRYLFFNSDIYPLDFYSIYCSYCGADDYKKNGFRPRENIENTQRYYCKSCRKKFTSEPIPDTHYPLWVHDRILYDHVKGDKAEEVKLNVIKISKQLSEKNSDPVIETCKSTVLDTIYNDWKLLSTFEYHIPHNVLDQHWEIDDIFIRLPNNIKGYIFNIVGVKTKYWFASYFSKNRNQEEQTYAIEQAIRRAGFYPALLISDGFQPDLKKLHKKYPWMNIKSVSKGEYYGIVNHVERVNETNQEGILKKGKCFRSEKYVKVSTELTRQRYNFLRPHMSLSGNTPAHNIGVKLPIRSWVDLFKIADYIRRKELRK